jgi:hypothetical protein
MTSREKLENMLVNNGMFESQAKEVIDIAIPELNNILDDYKFTFDRPASEYPNVIYTLLFMHIKPIALKWIEKNCPMAWYKPMFMN